MKKLIFFCFLFVCFLSVNSQVPEAFNYQAVVRNASGEIISNTDVSLRISILQESESGSVVYSEVHNTTTNNFGLVNLVIGKGEVLTGIFSPGGWGIDKHFIKMEIDPEGGDSYINMGTSQLLSVPYAFHAQTVEEDQIDDADADPINEIQALTLSGTLLTLSNNGGTVTLPTAGDGGDNWGTQVAQTDESLNGDGSPANPLGVKQDVLLPEWANVQSIPAGFADNLDNVDDADTDPSNELQNISISGTVLTLSEGGGTVELPSSGGGDNWGTQTVETDTTLTGSGTTANPLGVKNTKIQPPWANVQNKPAGFADNIDNVDDADADITNEIQTLSKTDNIISLSNEGGTVTDEINDADSDPTNEIQALSISGTNLTLSEGGGTVELPTSGGGDNWGTQKVETDATLDGEGTTTLPLKLAQHGAVSGEVLKWNGTTWFPGNDLAGTSLWQINGSSIYYNSGKIGIGTSAPIGPLDVYKNGETFVSIRSNVDNALILLDKGSSSHRAEIFFRDQALNKFFVGLDKNNDFRISSTFSTLTGLKVVDSGDVILSNNLDVSGQIQIREGTPGEGKVLTSDVDGLASWQTPEGSLWQQNGSNVYYNDGWVGIGIIPSHPLTIYNPSDRCYIRLWDDFATHGITVGSFEGNLLLQNRNIDKNIRLDIHSSSGDIQAMTIDGSSGNIGIGELYPDSKLEVAGQVKITGGSPGVGKVLTSDIDGLASWQTPEGSFWQQNGSNIFYNSGGVGMGTDNPTADLHIFNDDHSSINIESSTQDAILYLRKGATNRYAVVDFKDGFSTKFQMGLLTSNDFWISTSSLSLNGLEIKSDGNITLSDNLDITGRIQIRGGGHASGYVLTCDNAGLASWMPMDDNDWTTSGSNMYSSVSGNIGIGKTNPDVKLDVVGNRIRLANSGGDWIALRADGSAGFLDITHKGKLVIQGDADGDHILLNPARSSKVGIRMWSPVYDLDVKGDIRATGSVYYGGTAGNTNGIAYTKPDFVFENSYHSMSTDEVENFLEREKHLPWVTSAEQEKKENGDVTDMTRMAFETLESIENLQLQLIELKDEINRLRLENNKLKTTNRLLDKRLSKLETY